MFARAALCALVAALLVPSFLLAAPDIGVRKGSVNITAVLVDEEMKLHPVPLHGMVLSSERDTTDLRTDTDGTAEIQVAPGVYNLRSASAVRFKSHSYSWSLPITVHAGTSTKVALTNDNAKIEALHDERSIPENSRLDPAAALYQKLGPGVFRVEAGLAHGTGFLADTLGGVIITNAHVIENTEASDLSVLIDQATRIPAQLLAHDPESDIAILRVNPDRIRDRPRLALQTPDGKPPVVAGERLVALGFPLHQELTMTTGIASNIRAGAVISDVNINPGNSGGPLLNVDGEVVAVNTFGDVSSRGGPGISGSILIGRAGPALARAGAELRLTSPPAAELLPVMPRDRMEIAGLKAYADSLDFRNYRKYSNLQAGPFEVTIQTPTQTLVAIKAYEAEIAKDRKKREAKAGLAESERYSEIREYRDWIEYVGDQTTPVISLAVVPTVGETGGSAFKRFMLGSNLQATYKFKGDVRGVAILRNGVQVTTIRGGHTPMKVFQENRWVSLKDVADQGLYIFDPAVFRPDSLGAPPSIVVAIRDLKSPKKLKCLELPRGTVAQAWNDFAGFYSQQRPSERFIRAVQKLDWKGAMESNVQTLGDECSWSYQW